jgi:thiamine-phosphate pyrophosphorylase
VIALAAPWDVPVLVNDRVEVAIATGADGVHLKESGIAVEDARARLGARVLVGASCHDADGVARRGSADYLVLGPFASVPGKGPPLGEARFAEIARRARPPVLALGGIDASSTPRAIRAGAHGVAVTRAILASDDPARATRALLEAIGTMR